MSFKYYNIPIFALNKEKEVDDLVKVLLINFVSNCYAEGK